MQIIVKTLTGKTITLEVEGTDSIAKLKLRIAEKEAQFASSPSQQSFLQLIFDGKSLLDNESISQSGIRDGGEIIQDFAFPKLKTSKQCSFDTCSKKPLVGLGDCKYCSGKYCGAHRLPEDHLCSNLQDCKNASFDKNKQKLMKEKCTSVRIQS